MESSDFRLRGLKATTNQSQWEGQSAEAGPRPQLSLPGSLHTLNSHLPVVSWFSDLRWI